MALSSRDALIMPSSMPIDDNDVRNELVDWCRKYLFLPRISSDQVILNALVNSKAALSCERTFHLADCFEAGTTEDSPGGYLGLRHQASSSTHPPSLNSLIVKYEVALAQIEADRARPVDPLTSGQGRGEDKGTQKPHTKEGTRPPGPGGVAHPPPPPKPQLPTRYVATVNLDPTRASLQMSAYMEEVISHLQALPGAEISLTLEVQATAQGGIDEATARILLENSVALKVDNPGLY